MYTALKCLFGVGWWVSIGVIVYGLVNKPPSVFLRELLISAILYVGWAWANYRAQPA